MRELPSATLWACRSAIFGQSGFIHWSTKTYCVQEVFVRCKTSSSIDRAFTSDMRGHMFESGEEIVIPNVYWTLLSIEPKTTWLFCSPLVSLAQTCEQSGQPSGLSYIKKQMHIYVFIYYRLYENLSTVDWALGSDTKGREFESGKKKLFFRITTSLDRNTFVLSLDSHFHFSKIENVQCRVVSL